MSATQTFHRGDLVRIANSLGRHMRYFESDCDAIVIGSYFDQYGGGELERKQYTLHIKGRGQTSWYDESQLSLVETQQLRLLEQWKNEEAEAAKTASDLDWIFANGLQVLKSTHSASIESLSRCIGIENLWGANGEGVTWYANAYWTIAIAKPFLETSDKAGYLELCKHVKSTTRTSQP